MCYFDYTNPYWTDVWYTTPTFVNYAPNGNPTVNVTVNKSRKRAYDTNGTTKVFLKDGEEFELELFNTTTRKVGAQILLNGEPISQRIVVLNPGQRAFIERYLDDNKRFKFSTYEVEAGNSVVDAAIANNGQVEVRFFYEKQKPQHNLLQMHTASLGGQSTNSIKRGMLFKSAPSNDALLGSTANYSASNETTMDSFSAFADMSMERSVPEMKETGRVAEGSASSQSFRSVSVDFEAYHFASVSVKIEPVSNQPIEASDIRVYCSECGRKQKPGEKFCPACGKKYD